ncbi:MAG: hypothetical protein IJO97_06705 [Lachnospiraceae bacterium]|nr:hypothetical protein [Lachnospiraceae bacterium]
MKYVLLGDVISSAKVSRAGDDEYPVLSITKSEGIVFQDEKFKKRIASKDTVNYKVVVRGMLVQGIHIDEANFGIQNITDRGIVSPAYKIWEVNESKIVPRYLEIVLRTPKSIAYYSSKFNGSVKRRERISDKDFLNMPIPCPSIEEQNKAVQMLEAAKNIIDSINKNIEKYDELIKARLRFHLF